MRRILFCLACTFASPAIGDVPVVEGVSINQSGSGYSVSVTLSHPDTGWDHYADAWRVETEDGTVLATRELLHPHVDEQPFERSTRVDTIPEGRETLFIRARCLVDGWGENRVSFSAPGR